MKISNSFRYEVGSALAAVAILAGCAGATSQLQLTAPSARGIAPSLWNTSQDGRSWMALDAEKQNLLYVSTDTNTNGYPDDVYVYSYPKAKLVGTLAGFVTPEGECVDKSGDVFITQTDAADIVEYAHGGTSPIATLSDTGWAPQACAIDPTTGNLAVTNVATSNGGGGSIAIYSNASGTPAYYTDLYLYRPYFCGYDDSGNLFIDGFRTAYGTFQFAELPKGSSSFANINLNKHLFTPGGVQWDGKHVSVGDQGEGYGSTVYQTNGAGGKVVGTTPLNNSCEVAQFWIDGHQLVAPTNDCNQSVAFYRYPAGGDATRTISGLENAIFAVAVSPKK
jgi:hypothetical protein